MDNPFKKFFSNKDAGANVPAATGELGASALMSEYSTI